MSSPLMPSKSQEPHERAVALLRLLEDNSQGDYIGESISQLEHSLQCAHLAVKAGSSSSTTAAALLHDVGQFLPISLLKQHLPPQSSSQGPDETPVGRPNHALWGAVYLASLGFPSHTTNIVGQHVAAKRYLTAVDAGYLEQLSEASRATLKHQGGPMSAAERKAFEEMEGWRECLQVRRWDDMAKVVGIENETPRVWEYVDVVENVLRHAGDG